MKHTLIAILFIALAIPCSAQWQTTNTTNEVVAFGVHDTSFFVSFGGGIGRLNPTGEADTGINFNYGNVTSFDSLGAYFFANIISPTPFSFETTNNGSRWTLMDPVIISSNGYDLFGSYISIVGTKTFYYLVRSTNNGATWDSISSFSNGYPATLATMGSCLYGTVDGVQIWRSLDTGHTWAQLSPPFVGTMMTMGAVLFMYPSSNPGQPIVSLDSGSHWSALTVDSNGTIEYVTCLATDGRNVFAGTIRGIYVSLDTGKTWRAENEGLGIMEAEALGVYDTLVYASMTQHQFPYATYYRPLKEMIDTTPASVVQTRPPGDSIGLCPNPATGIVTVVGGGTSILSVSVLNVLGEDVLDIPNSYSSTLSFDVSRLASGTYFARIQTAAGTVLKKITLER